MEWMAGPAGGVEVSVVKTTTQATTHMHPPKTDRNTRILHLLTLLSPHLLPVRLNEFYD